MSNSKTLKIILGLLCLLILAIFVSYYFVYKDIKQKNESYHKNFYNLTFHGDKQGYLFSIQKAIEDNGADIESLDSSIISKDGEIEFIEELELLAKTGGLSIEIDSLSVENTLDFASSTVETLRIKARTKGSWSGSYLFLSRLEAMPFKIKINKFGLSSALNDPVSGKRPSSKIWQSMFEIDVLKHK